MKCFITTEESNSAEPATVKASGKEWSEQSDLLIVDCCAIKNQILIMQSVFALFLTHFGTTAHPTTGACKQPLSSGQF